MTKLTLWTDGFDMATIEGDIELIECDQSNNNYTLKLKLKDLRIIQPTTLIFTNKTDDWLWLKDLPISEIEIDGQKIKPLWKPNKYGEPADSNVFQTMSINNGAITLFMHANGTEEDVFNRYNPYLKRGTNEHITLEYVKQNLTMQEYIQQSDNSRIPLKTKLTDEILLNLFE